MNEINVLKKNSFYYTISSVARLFTNSIIFILIARSYGVNGFGSFATAHTLSSLFLLLADFGFDILITTEIARNRTSVDSIIQKYFPVKVFFTAFAWVLLLFTIYIIPSTQEAKSLIFIFSINMVFTTMLNMIYAVYKGIEEFQHEAKISLTMNLLLLVGIVFLSKYSVNLYWIAVLMVAIRLLGFLLGVIVISKHVAKKPFHFSFKQSFQEFKVVLIFGLHLIFGTMFFQIDSVLIFSLKGENEAGLYQAVFKVMVIVIMLSEIFIGVMLPTITRLFNIGDENWVKYGKFLFKLLYVISLPASLFFYQYPEFIINVVYNKQEYLSSAGIMKIAGIIIFIRFFSEPFAMMLTVANKQITRTKIVISASIFNILLNILFIPMFGIIASIIISAITNLFVGALYIYFTKDTFKIWINDRKLFIPIFFIAVIKFLMDSLKLEANFMIVFIILFLYSIVVGFFNFSKTERGLIFNLKKAIT
ncbi:MAG: oligosaccharide flippase family protein [Bacteroidetes bacterium]|nr:oligosaccharide flippase family protein [Bacteroidota bacterium]